MLKSTLSVIIILVYSAFTQAASLNGARFKKVVWVVFENTNYQKAIQQPDFAAIASKGALFTNFTAGIHPSQGNYISMIAGSNFGIRNDNNIDLNSQHLGDLLENAGKTWKVYAEDYPGNCFTGIRSGAYVRKHNPFMNFTNVSRNPNRCVKIESSINFNQDFSNNTLADFSMYIPNMKNDGHDTGVDFAGKYLTSRFGKMLTTSLPSDVLFIINFDESGSSAINQVYTVLLSGSIIAGVQNSQLLNHTALLKLIEDEFSLNNLGQGDLTSPSIIGIWK